MANCGGVERSEAEAIYDSGREACVGFLLELTAGFEARAARYEAQVGAWPASQDR